MHEADAPYVWLLHFGASLRTTTDLTLRLDGPGLLTPSIDHLFDRGFISFANNGHLLISPVAHKESLN
jgi:hypothetical protein